MSFLRILFFFALVFFWFQSVFSAWTILHNRFESFYSQAETLYWKGDYKEAWRYIIQYIDLVSFSDCKGYKLYEKINQKQNLPTVAIDQLYTLCMKVSESTLTDKEFISSLEFFKKKKEYDIFSVFWLHLLILDRLKQFDNQYILNKSDILSFDVKKIESFSFDSPLVSNKLNLFFYSYFSWESEDFLWHSQSLKDKDFFLKPVYILYDMYKTKRTIEWYEKILSFEDIILTSSLYNFSYKNLALLYFYEKKNYDKYFDYLRLYKESLGKQSEISQFQFLFENSRLLAIQWEKYLLVMENVFWKDYATFISYLATTFSNILDLEKKYSSMDSPQRNELNASLLVLLGYYTKNKDNIDKYAFYDSISGREQILKNEKNSLKEFENFKNISHFLNEIYSFAKTQWADLYENTEKDISSSLIFSEGVLSTNTWSNANIKPFIGNGSKIDSMSFSGSNGESLWKYFYKEKSYFPFISFFFSIISFIILITLYFKHPRKNN